jgi:fatty-acid desaturase
MSYVYFYNLKQGHYIHKQILEQNIQSTNHFFICLLVKSEGWVVKHYKHYYAQRQKNKCRGSCA